MFSFNVEKNLVVSANHSFTAVVGREHAALIEASFDDTFTKDIFVRHLKCRLGPADSVAVAAVMERLGISRDEVWEMRDRMGLVPWNVDI
jgi:hypothetical protein